MDATLESLLLRAKAVANLADKNADVAYNLLRQATQLDPAAAAEDLFRFHLTARDYSQTETVLDEFGYAIAPYTLKVLRAVSAALVHGRSPSQDDLADLQPAPEAEWPLLYLGILQHARGDISTARSTLFKFINRIAWRETTGKNLAVEILLQNETRRCLFCRVRKPHTYLQDGRPLCRRCATLSENKTLERIATWYVLRSVRKQNKQMMAPFVPVLPPAHIIQALDDDATAIWNRARQITGERGRATTGAGDLGMALFEGPFNKQFFCYLRDQESALRGASSLPEEAPTGPERVGEQLAWLLNIAHWFRRLFRGGPQSTDHSQEPLDSRLLKMAFSVCYPGPTSLMGSSLALVLGFNLTEAQVNLFEALLRESPDSYFLHVLLGSHHRKARLKGERELEHELWLIKHYPSAARSHEHWTSIDPSKHRACVDAWVDAVCANIDNPDALQQAASFFKWEFPRLSNALAERCNQLEPTHRAWTSDAIDSLDRLLREASGLAEQRSLAKEYLQVLERAQKRPPASYTSSRIRTLIAQQALNAQAFEKAGEAAVAVLAESPEATLSYPHDYNHHTAHSVLGLLALREGDVEKAKEHLLASTSYPPRDRADAPIWQLARLLWQIGEHEVLRRYLGMCRLRWAESETDPWLADMRDRFPNFSAWAAKQPRRVTPKALSAIDL